MVRTTRPISLSRFLRLPTSGSRQVAQKALVTLGSKREGVQLRVCFTGWLRAVHAAHLARREEEATRHRDRVREVRRAECWTVLSARSRVRTSPESSTRFSEYPRLPLDHLISIVRCYDLSVNSEVAIVLSNLRT